MTPARVPQGEGKVPQPLPEAHGLGEIQGKVGRASTANVAVPMGLWKREGLHVALNSGIDGVRLARFRPNGASRGRDLV